MTRRIVHVITRGDVGGAQTHVVDLALAQRAAGHEVSVIAGTGGPAVERLRDARVDATIVHSLGRSRGNPLQRRAVRDLRSAIVEADPDIIHAHSSNAGLLARISGRLDGIPCVYTAHGWPFQRGAAPSQRMMSWMAEVVGGKLGHAVICLTDIEADRARRAHVARPGRVYVVQNCLADRAVSTPDRDGRQGPPEIVMVARFSPPKLQQQVVEAMSTLLGQEWNLTFVGDGRDLADCSTLAERLLGDRVKFLGHRDDVDAILDHSDISILWSRYEGMPISLLEAMRAGLACVASDLPGVRAVFGSPPTGIIATDRADLALGVSSLLEHPAERRALGAAGRQRFESTFSIGTMIEAIDHVYDVVLGEAGGNVSGVDR